MFPYPLFWFKYEAIVPCSPAEEQEGGGGGGGEQEDGGGEEEAPLRLR